MLVRDVMTRLVAAADPSALLVEAAERLPVVAQGEIVGLVARRDLRRCSATAATTG